MRVSLLPAETCRVFWLNLPPLKPAQRIAAAQLALRNKIANPVAAQAALGASPAPNGLWCAAVRNAGLRLDAALPNIPAAALTPWKPNEVSWRRGLNDHAITAAGESIALESGDAALPDALVHACADPRTAHLRVYVNDAAAQSLANELREEWQAQLGIPVSIALAAPPEIPAAQKSAWWPDFRAPFALQARASTRRRTGHWAAGIAACAGVAHLAFSATAFVSARQSLQQQTALIAALAEQSKTRPSDWRVTLQKSAPNASRDSAAQLLDVSATALAPTSAKLKSLSYGARALSMEWNALTDGERDAFVASIQANGASVVSAGTKARVFWP